MNNFTRILLIGSVIVLPSAAFASDGAVQFDGAITASTCEAQAPNGGTVTLPIIQKEALAGGQTAGATAFSIVPTNCTDQDNGRKTVTLFFEAGPNVDPLTGYIKNPTGEVMAQNVKIVIYNDQMAQIIPGDPNQAFTTPSSIAGLSGGGANAGQLRYVAAYIADGGTPTPGLVGGSVTYSFNYK